MLHAGEITGTDQILKKSRNERAECPEAEVKLLKLQTSKLGR